MTITLYTKPGCVQCEYTAKHLTAKGLPFNVFDVSESKEARKIVQDTGVFQLPYVVVEHNGNVVDTWHGFKDDKIKGLSKDS